MSYTVFCLALPSFALPECKNFRHWRLRCQTGWVPYAITASHAAHPKCKSGFRICESGVARAVQSPPPPPSRSREGWFTITVSVLAWFIPDTAFSLWSGFWQNAVFNTVFVVLFAIPLAATYRAFPASCRQRPVSQKSRSFNNFFVWYISRYI